MGTFHTDRELFKNPIWKNITEFRLFFLIYGSAIFAEEGYRVSEDLFLERGQWCRSTRKIQEDLTFIENRQIKTYSTSTISRCIKALVQSQRICTKTHELGTVFTVVNYELYQGFGGSKKDNLERNLEQSQNSNETVSEQSQNNNNKENKEKKEKKEKDIKIPYAVNVKLTEPEYQRLLTDFGKELTDSSIQFLSSYKIEKDYKTKDDNLTIRRWVMDAAKKTNVRDPIKGGSNVVQFGESIRQGTSDGETKAVEGKSGLLPSAYRAEIEAAAAEWESKNLRKV